VEILSRGKCRRPCRHIASGKPIGGSSAGLAVLGEFSFSSMIDTIHSPAALADPYVDILLALTELRLKGEESYGAGFWSGSLRRVAPKTALLQRRTTKRLYFWATRPSVLFGDEQVYDRSEEKAKRKPYIPGLKRRGFTAKKR
jgi:hypothetical protein